MKRILINYKVYNGFKDVMFVMSAKIFERNKSFMNKDNYTDLGIVDVKAKKFKYDNKTWVVFADNSTRPE